MSLEERAKQLEGLFQSEPIDRNFLRRTYRASFINNNKKDRLWKATTSFRKNKYLRFKQNAARKLFIAMTLERRIVFFDKV